MGAGLHVVCETCTYVALKLSSILRSFWLWAESTEEKQLTAFILSVVALPFAIFIQVAAVNSLVTSAGVLFEKASSTKYVWLKSHSYMNDVDFFFTQGWDSRLCSLL